MSSAPNNQSFTKGAKMHGTAALHRSRTYALWSMTTLLLCMFCLCLIPMPVPSVKAETSPLVLEMRQFSPRVEPEPSLRIVEQVNNKKKILLAEESLEVVALPEYRPEPKPEQKLVTKSDPKPEKKQKPTEPIQKKKQEKTEPIKEKTSSTVVPQTVSWESSPVAVSIAASVNTTTTKAAKEKKALALLMQAIERNKEYPKQARRANTEGTITLLVEVGPDGKVRMCSVQGGGPSVLEKATRLLGEKLVGLNLETSGQSFSVRVPVNYSLH